MDIVFLILTLLFFAASWGFVKMKALEYEAEKRFSSADEMKAALNRCIRKDGKEPAPARVASLPPVSTQRLTTEVEDAPAAAPDAVRSSAAGVLPIWEFKCEDEIRSSPVVADGILYVGVYDNNLYALDAKTGQFHGNILPRAA